MLDKLAEKYNLQLNREQAIVAKVMMACCSSVIRCILSSVKFLSQLRY